MQFKTALKCTVASLLASNLTVPSVFAQSTSVEEETEDNGDVIIVTGRLKEESLQDLPGSVVAVGGEELQAAGVFDIESFAVSVINFNYTTSVGASDNLFIRGIGTVGSGPHFEPAVGQQLNGVAFSRSRIGRAGLIDTAQVEILRGPQGAVSGRNTSLGLVNIVPNKPTDEFEASFFGSYDFEDNKGYEVEGMVSGPVANGIRARLVVNYKDKDGHVRNVNPAVGGTAGARDDFTIRGILDFDIGSRGNFELFGQYVDGQRVGKIREIVNCDNPALALAVAGDDCLLNRTQVQQAIFDGVTIPQEFNVDLRLVTGTFNYEVFDNITFTSLTSYTDYSITDVIDTDLGPRERLIITNAEDYTQFTQELRLYGELTPGLDFIVGGLYSEYDLDFFQQSNANGFGPGGGRARNQFAQQRNEGISVFGDLTYEISPEITVSGGVRYISEDRAARAGQIQTTRYTLQNELGACGTPSGLFGCSFFPLFPEFTAGTALAGAANTTGGPFFDTGILADGPFFETNDEEVTWNVNAQWRPIDDTMFYASVATGFKAGNFNLVAGLLQTPLEQNFSFEPETTINYEVGGRHVFGLGNGDLTFNWTVFRLEVEDQQISAIDPVTVAQVTQSAGNGRSQGIEIDGVFAIENFRMGYSFAYTDAKYTNFQGATCFSGQTVAQGCIGGTQDRTGTTFLQAPDIQITVNVQNEFFISDNMTLTPFFEVLHVSDYFASTELSPESIVDGYIQLNARLTLAEADGKWNLSLVGQNLTDEVHFGFYGETTQVPGGGSFAFPSVGRTIALKGRFNF